jgi:hypothetical protein
MWFTAPTLPAPAARVQPIPVIGFSSADA